MTSNQFFRNLWIKPQIYIYKNQNKLFLIKTETDLNFQVFSTLESVIDVGQGISEGPGKFDKKNKRRALNTHVLCSK
jgi:hypothetical protein